MGSKQVKLKPVVPLKNDAFAELLRGFGARPAESDAIAYIITDNTPRANASESLNPWCDLINQFRVENV